MTKAALLLVTLGVAVGALAAPPAAFAGGTGATAGTVASSGTAATAAPSLSAITLSATDVLGGTSVTGTATLSASAPAGGVVVALSSDNPAAATVPAGVTVPAGSLSASFPVTTLTVPNPQSALIIGGRWSHHLRHHHGAHAFDLLVGQHLGPGGGQRPRQRHLAARRHYLQLQLRYEHRGLHRVVPGRHSGQAVRHGRRWLEVPGLARYARLRRPLADHRRSRYEHHLPAGLRTEVTAVLS